MAYNKDKNARITRWFSYLLDFKFTVEHRAGKPHRNADARSRRDVCCWSAVPHRGSELRGGGVCGGPASEQCPTWPHGGQGVRQRQPRGVVSEGRYCSKKVCHRDSAPLRWLCLTNHRCAELAYNQEALYTLQEKLEGAGWRSLTHVSSVVAGSHKKTYHRR